MTSKAAILTLLTLWGVGTALPHQAWAEETTSSEQSSDSKDDETGLIVHRGSTCYVVMNLFPYNPGHVLICPYRHIADYTETTDEEAAEIAAMTKQAMTVIRSVSNAGGFNIGMNQGHIAGAGIAAHLHQHVVPRWPGDQNFMPIIGRTKTLPELLSDTRELLAKAWTE